MALSNAAAAITNESAGNRRYKEIRRVTIVGALINALLSAIKLIFGYLAHSQALIADGLHSLSDLASDILLLFAAKHATRNADEEHPYGHGRIETVFGIVQGAILGAFALGIAYDAGQRLFNPERLMTPELVALIIAGVSVLAKELLYRYTIEAARRLRSNMLRGNAWDHRSDAISSIIVVIGVAGTLAGLPYLDALAAIGVALMIIKISGDLIWQSVRELIDTALDAERGRADPRADPAGRRRAACAHAAHPQERRRRIGRCAYPGRSDVERVRRSPHRREGPRRTDRRDRGGGGCHRAYRSRGRRDLLALRSPAVA